MASCAPFFPSVCLTKDDTKVRQSRLILNFFFHSQDFKKGFSISKKKSNLVFSTIFVVMMARMGIVEEGGSGDPVRKI